MYFDFGSGPRKSMWFVCHGYGGIVEGSSGWGVGLFDAAVHNIHSDIFTLIFASILIKKNFL